MIACVKPPVVRHKSRKWRAFSVLSISAMCCWWVFTYKDSPFIPSWKDFIAKEALLYWCADICVLFCEHNTRVVESSCSDYDGKLIIDPKNVSNIKWVKIDNIWSIVMIQNMKRIYINKFNITSIHPYSWSGKFCNRFAKVLIIVTSSITNHSPNINTSQILDLRHQVWIFERSQEMSIFDLLIHQIS